MYVSVLFHANTPILIIKWQLLFVEFVGKQMTGLRVPGPTLDSGEAAASNTGPCLEPSGRGGRNASDSAGRYSETQNRGPTGDLGLTARGGPPRRWRVARTQLCGPAESWCVLLGQRGGCGQAGRGRRPGWQGRGRVAWASAHPDEEEHPPQCSGHQGGWVTRSRDHGGGRWSGGMKRGRHRGLFPGARNTGDTHR